MSFQLKHLKKYFEKIKIKNKMGKKKLLRHLNFLSKSNLNLSQNMISDDVTKASPSSPVTSFTPSQELLSRTWKTSLRVCWFELKFFIEFWTMLESIAVPADHVWRELKHFSKNHMLKSVQIENDTVCYNSNHKIYSEMMENFYCYYFSDNSCDVEAWWQRIRI